MRHNRFDENGNLIHEPTKQLIQDKPRPDILYPSGELSRLYVASHHRAQQYSATS